MAKPSRVTRVSFHFTDFESLATFAAKGAYIHHEDRSILGSDINIITLCVVIPAGCKRVDYHEILMRRAFSVGAQKVTKIIFDPYGEIDDDALGGISIERGQEIRMEELDKQIKLTSSK